jgi:putative ABC transport system ATP-binding protein
LYQLTDVSKVYKKGPGQVTALNGVTMTIDDGEFIAIQGSTGHGKSTLLQLLGGLDHQTEGKVSFDGRDLGDMSDKSLAELRAREFGFIFQTFNLIPTLSAAENVQTAMVPLHVSAAQRKQRALAALDDVGLKERATHLPGELSGGEQQRVAIARALVKDPHVVLADEPTGNLDENTRDEIVGLLEKLWTDRGVTLVVVTHDGQVASRAKRKVRLTDGTIDDRPVTREES